MAKGELLSNMSAHLSTLVFKLDQNAPAIGFWGGMALILGGAGWGVYKACKKVPEIKRNRDIAEARVKLDRNSAIITEEEFEQETKNLKTNEIKETVKAFAGPAILTAGGVALQIGGWTEMNNRFDAVATQLAVEAAAFSAYRKRTANVVGKDAEEAIYYGADVRAITVEEKDEDGNVVSTRTEYLLEEGEQDIPFDPYTYEFSPDTTDLCEPADDMHEYNLTTLKVRQEEWNKLLHNGLPMVWLNDILRALGLSDDENFAARKVGWLNPDFFYTEGDGYIDFRVTPVRYIASDGVERWKYMLNFNCDGDILSMGIKQRGLSGKANKKVEG